MNVHELANAGKNGAGQDTSLRNYILEEFIEDYQEGEINRREALQRIAAITGSVAIASAILAACATPDEQAASPETAGESSAQPASPTAGVQSATEGTPGMTVSPNDPDIEANEVEVPGDGVALMGYVAKPSGDGPFPAVLVCHENRGLNEHIRDVARRFAKAGYVGLALDMLSRQGGTDAAGGRFPSAGTAEQHSAAAVRG